MATDLPSVLPMPNPFDWSESLSSFPDTVDISTSADVSWQYGFPPLTAQPIEDGGIPPSRHDMNRLGRYALWPLWMLQQGRQFTFDEGVSAAIGGYPLGAILYYYKAPTAAVPNGECYLLRSTKANNTDNFNTDSSYIGTSWVDVSPRPALLGVPTGGIVASLSGVSGSADMTGFLYCNGSAVNIADYPALYNVIGGNFGSTTTTFNLPDMRGRFLEGATANGKTTRGKYVAAGLPNIVGDLGYFNVWRSWTVPTGATNPFYTGSTRRRSGEEDAGRDNETNLKFNASRYNGIFGGSSTVQPAALCVDFWIRY